MQTHLLGTALVCLTLMFYPCSVICAPAPTSSPTTSTVEPEDCSKLPYFQVGDFVYGRKPGPAMFGHPMITLDGKPSSDPETEFAERQLDEYTWLLQKVCDRGNDKQMVIQLLKDIDPRVRTLALASLFDREDPSLLPDIRSLCSDTAETFITHYFAEYASFDVDDPPPPPFRSQTVGDIARSFLSFYTSDSGFDYTKFEKYWSERKDRRYCASWCAVRMLRASEGSSPIMRERLALTRRLIQEVQQLPNPDRCLELLYLSNGSNASQVLSGDFLLSECKNLTAEQLLHVVELKPDSNDPDIKSLAAGHFHALEGMSNFILSHAGQLLRPEQIPVLSSLRKTEKQSSSGVFYQAKRWRLLDKTIAELRHKTRKENVSKAKPTDQRT